MISRHNLIDWVEEALIKLGGKARIVDVAREIDRAHGAELKTAGDLAFTWHYDMRWAAFQLSERGRVLLSNKVGRSSWALAAGAAA